MDSTILFANSTKELLIKFNTIYNIDIEQIKEKLKNKVILLGKKLVKIEHIWELVFNNTEYKNILINELLILPSYLPVKINMNWVMSHKKINIYLIPFNTIIDIDIKELLSNILYLFIYYIYNHFTPSQIPEIIEHYILRLININKCCKIDYITLQEIILRSLLIEIVNQKYSKIGYTDFLNFINNIDNPILLEIINISFDTYKTIILSIK
jgi:hypothetical protein